MKALKTIVATAVIVLALTTVAMAGARQVGSRGDSAASAPGHTALQTHQSNGVTHIDAQSARHLRAVTSLRVAPHTTRADREMTRDRARDRSLQTGTRHDGITSQARESGSEPPTAPPTPTRWRRYPQRRHARR